MFEAHQLNICLARLHAKGKSLFTPDEEKWMLGAAENLFVGGSGQLDDLTATVRTVEKLLSYHQENLGTTSSLISALNPEPIQENATTEQSVQDVSSTDQSAPAAQSPAEGGAQPAVQQTARDAGDGPPLITKEERDRLVRYDTKPSESVARMEAEEAAYMARPRRQTGLELQKEYEAQQKAKKAAEETITPQANEEATARDAKDAPVIPMENLRVYPNVDPEAHKARRSAAFRGAPAKKGEKKRAIIVLDNASGEVFIRDIYLGQGGTEMIDAAGLKKEGGARGDPEVDFNSAKTGAKAYKVFDQKLTDGKSPRYSILGHASNSSGKSLNQRFANLQEFVARKNAIASEVAAAAQTFGPQGLSEERAIDLSGKKEELEVLRDLLSEGKTPEALLQKRFVEAVKHDLKRPDYTISDAHYRTMLDIAKEANARAQSATIRATRAQSPYRLSQQESLALFRNLALAVQAQGGEMVSFLQNADSEFAAVRDAYGLQTTTEEGRSLIALGLSSLQGVDSDATVKLAHEAGHQFIKNLDPRTRAMFEQAISQLPHSEQRWLMNPLSTDIRLLANSKPENLSPHQRELVANLTPEELNRARSIAPDVLLAEQAAEHLAMLGVAKGQARGIMDQVIRFIKDVMARVGVALQKSLGMEPAPEAVRRYVENSWLRFVNRDFAASQWPQSMRTALGLPATLRERVAFYPSPEHNGATMQIDLNTGQILANDFAPNTPEGQRDWLTAMLVAAENDQENAVSQTRRELGRGTLAPDIETNGLIAVQNTLDSIYAGTFSSPDIKRALGGVPLNDFLSDYLHLAPESFPTAMRDGLVKDAASATDYKGNKITVDPGAQINRLPAARDGTLGSEQERTIEKVLLNLGERITRVSTTAAKDQEYFDNLTERQKSGKRPLTPEELKVKSDIGVRLPIVEKIIARLRAEEGRLQGKIKATKKTEVYAGSEYTVPESSDQHPDQWKKRVVPMDLVFNPSKKAEILRDVAAYIEWARNPANEEYGAHLGYATGMAKKLVSIPVNDTQYAANSYRLTKTDTRGLHDVIRRIGTPAAQLAAGRLHDLESFVTAHTSTARATGKQWSYRHQRLKDALGRKDQFEESYHNEVYNAIIALREKIPSGTPNRINLLIDALNTLYKLDINTGAKRKAFADFFLELDKAHETETKAHADSGLTVTDEKLFGGKDITRGLIKRGDFTGRRTFSKIYGAAHSAMRDTWVKFHDSIDAIVADPAQLAKYFTPTVVRDFVEPNIRNTVQLFDVSIGGGIRKAQLVNVRSAWAKSGGDIGRFAANLHTLEGGDPKAVKATLAALLRNFDDKYRQMQAIIGENDSINGIGFETMPRAMMDARVAEDLPPEHLSYAYYDEASNLALIHQLAFNKAFGRNGFSAGGEMNLALAKIEEELKDLQDQLIRYTREGKSIKEIDAIMGRDKRIIATQAGDHIKSLSGFLEKALKLSRGTGANFGDFKGMVELLGLQATTIMQAPRPSLLQTIQEPLTPLYVMKFGPTALKMVARNIGYTTTEVLNTLLGTHLNSDMAQRRAEAGSFDSSAQVSLEEALANLGPGHALADSEIPQTGLNKVGKKVSRFVRNTRTRLEYGLFENLVQAFAKTSDRDMVAARKAAPGDLLAKRFSVANMFGNASRDTVSSNASTYIRAIDDFVLRGFEQIRKMERALTKPQFDKYLNELEAGIITLKPEEMGYDSTLGIFSDKFAWEKLRDDIALKMREGSPERLVASTWRRLGGVTEGKNILTPQQVASVITIADAELSLKANSLNASTAIHTNPYLKAASTFLIWPYLATNRALGGVRDVKGRPSADATRDTLMAVMLGALPATMASSLIVDFYDEEIFGKKSNMRKADLSTAIPVYGAATDPMATLERFGRYGGLGFVGDVANHMFNTDDARNGGLSLDNRVMAVSWARNFLDTISRFKNQDYTATYASVYRPMMNLIGLNGVLQYEQLAMRGLGLENQETAINLRTSLGNYLRAEGRALGLAPKRAVQAGFTATPVTPWISRMEYAAFNDDMELFRESYRNAIQAAMDMKKEDPKRYVQETFAAHHPLRRIFSTAPSEREYRSILASLDDTGREAVSSGINIYNRYAQRIGVTPFNGTRYPGGGNSRVTPMTLQQAHLRAAQAIASPGF